MSNEAESILGNCTTKEHGVIDGPSIIAGAKTETIS